MVSYWSATGQLLVSYWSTTGQLLVKSSPSLLNWLEPLMAFISQLTKKLTQHILSEALDKSIIELL